MRRGASSDEPRSALPLENTNLVDSVAILLRSAND